MSKITTAHEAFWFLQNHPKMNVKERHLLDSKEEADAMRAKGFTIHTFIHENKSESYYREYKHLIRHAMDKTLDIYYTKVDETRTINKDRSKNVNVECWLEFGHLEWHEAYDVHEGGTDKAYIMTYHDYELDCGAPTFDEALVILANNVLEQVGDYDRDADERGWTDNDDGSPHDRETCADCIDSRSMLKSMGIKD